MWSIIHVEFSTKTPNIKDALYSLRRVYYSLRGSTERVPLLIVRYYVCSNLLIQYLRFFEEDLEDENSKKKIRLWIINCIHWEESTYWEVQSLWGKDEHHITYCVAGARVEQALGKRRSEQLIVAGGSDWASTYSGAAMMLFQSAYMCMWAGSRCRVQQRPNVSSVVDHVDHLDTQVCS